MQAADHGEFSLGLALTGPGTSPMPAPRRYRDQTFRKTDIVRAYKAALAAGVPNPRIEIDREGTIKIVPSGLPKDNDSGASPWDQGPEQKC